MTDYKAGGVRPDSAAPSESQPSAVVLNPTSAENGNGKGLENGLVGWGGVWVWGRLSKFPSAAAAAVAAQSSPAPAS